MLPPLWGRALRRIRFSIRRKHHESAEAGTSRTWNMGTRRIGLRGAGDRDIASRVQPLVSDKLLAARVIARAPDEIGVPFPPVWCPDFQHSDAGFGEH